MVKNTKKKINGSLNRQARVSSEGFRKSAKVTGICFSGRPIAAGDLQLIQEACSMSEPDWSLLKFDQLVAAERMACHRLSGGETVWRGVLERIHIAMACVR